MGTLSPQELDTMLTSEFADLQPKNTWGETSYFLNPGGKFSNGAYFATIKEKDGDNDKASNLDREGIFRLNFGPQKKDYVSKFGPPPARPPKGCIIEGPWDFTEVDQIMPHPIYGWMGWLCVLNPTTRTIDEVKPLLNSAYAKASSRVKKRLAKK